MESLKRMEYFGYIFILGVVGYFLGLNATSDTVFLVLFVMELGARVWLTMARCRDIGITEAHAWWVLVPFALFYFLFKGSKK